MKVRNFFKKIKSQITDKQIYATILTLTAIIAVFGIYQYRRSENFKNKVESGYKRAFSELADYVNNIDNTLTKALVANTPSQLTSLSVDLWREAAFAKANLGQLPLSSTQLDNTSKFLSQVGDYTYSLSKKVENGDVLSEKETSQLTALSKYASDLNKNIKNMQNDLYSGNMDFSNMTNLVKNIFNSDSVPFVTNMEEVEKSFTEYASLIYDGPFSEHIMNKDPVMLIGKKEINENQAIEEVKKYFSNKKINSVEIVGTIEGQIPSYNCIVKTVDANREINVAISKKGGYVFLITDSRTPEKTTLDISKASEIAREYLQTLGYNNMHESYFQKEGNSVIINYAYKQDDFVMYTDLIKVKVALDNGEIIGFEAHGYIINHIEERPLPQIKITPEQAKTKVRNNVKIKDIDYALIPLDNGNNVYCYEIKCNFNDRNFLVYVNVENGNEEKILILLENDDGILTI